MSIDCSYDTLSSFIGIDVQSIEILADIVKRFELGINRAAHVGLDS